VSRLPVSLRAAARILGMEGDPRAASVRLRRHLIAVEQRDGRPLLVHAGGKGYGRRYRVSIAALRERCPELFPTRRDELAEAVTAEIAKVEERFEQRFEQLSDRVELLAETVLELAKARAEGA